MCQVRLERAFLRASCRVRDAFRMREQPTGAIALAFDEYHLSEPSMALLMTDASAISLTEWPLLLLRIHGLSAIGAGTAAISARSKRCDTAPDAAGEAASSG